MNIKIRTDEIEITFKYVSLEVGQGQRNTKIMLLDKEGSMFW